MSAPSSSADFTEAAVLASLSAGTGADAQPTKVAKEMVEEMLKAQNAKLSTQIGG